MSLIPNENLRHRSDYPGDDCSRYIDENAKLTASCNELVAALEHISTHPCEDSLDAQRMTRVAQVALTNHAKRMKGEK